MKSILQDVEKRSGKHMLADETVRFTRVMCYLAYVNKKIDNKQLVFFDSQKKFEKSLFNLASLVDSNTKDRIKELYLLVNIQKDSELNSVYERLLQFSNKELLELFDNCGLENITLLKNMHQYETENSIIDLILRLNKGRKVNLILDLCSGTGAFLSKVANVFPNSKMKGIEINDFDGVISKLRLDMLDVQYDISHGDVLATSLDPMYDLVLCNHPWMIRYSKSIKSDHNPSVNFNDVKNRADWAFVAKAINSINETGKAYVLLPQGCLFNVMETKYREELVKKGLVEMVISMPRGTLLGTNVNYSLLVLSKNNKVIKLINGTNCFIKEKNFNKLDVDSLISIIDIQNQKNVIEKQIAELKEKNYSFDPATYFGRVFSFENPIKLKEVADIFRGVQYIAKEVDELKPGEGQYSIVKISDLDNTILEYSQLVTSNFEKNKVEKFILKENDILLTTKGTVLKLAFIKGIGDRQVIPGGNLTVIRVLDHNKINPLYLFTFLQGETGLELLNSIQTGSVIMSIPKKVLDDLSVPLVDMDTQEVIANKFILLNSKISDLKNELRNLNNKISIIYESEVGD